MNSDHLACPVKDRAGVKEPPLSVALGVRTADEVHVGIASSAAEQLCRGAGNRLCVLGKELGAVRRVEAFLARW